MYYYYQDYSFMNELNTAATTTILILLTPSLLLPILSQGRDCQGPAAVSTDVIGMVGFWSNHCSIWPHAFLANPIPIEHLRLYTYAYLSNR